MNWKSTVLPYIACLFIASGGVPLAHAEPPVGARGSAAGVSCDTEEQARQYLDLWDGTNGMEVLTQINTAAGSPVCLAGQILMELVAYHGYHSNKVGEWRIGEMNVYGVNVGGAVMRFREPIKQYTGFPVPKEPVRGSSI